jgi:diacylglycerol kinase
MPNFFLNRIRAFKFALKGIKVLSSETHFRVHIVIGLCTIALGYVLKLSHTEWLIVLLCIGAVLSAEAFNSALERVVDKISPDYNIEAGKIKDTAAAAVLLLSIFVAIVGLLLFVPKMLLLLF